MGEIQPRRSFAGGHQGRSTLDVDGVAPSDLIQYLGECRQGLGGDLYLQVITGTVEKTDKIVR